MVQTHAFFRRNANAFDVIDVHKLDWLAGWAGFIGQATERPVVGTEATEPCLLPIDQRSVPRRRTLSWCRMKLSAYVAKHTDAAAALQSKGVRREKIHIVPNGVCVSATPPPTREGKDLLFVGNLYQGDLTKGLDVLFQAWPLIVREHPSARLTVVGRGSTVSYQRALKEAGCLDTVSFAGHRDSTDVLYRRASILLLPSRVEGMSNALLEAQAAGTPAVVSDIAGNRAVIRHGHNGLLSRTGDARDFAAQACRLLSDSRLCRRMSRYAWREMQMGYDINSVAKKMCTVYDAVLAGLGRSVRESTTVEAT